MIVYEGVFIMFMSNFGFGKPSGPAMCGGKVDHTNHAAPKNIKSKKITGFNARFYLDHNDSGDDNYSGFYHFTIEKGVLSEDRLNISEQINESVTEKLQAIIEKYDLVKKNGVDVHTSGLPPEFQPCYLSADYESGENLYFSENNDPRSPWAREIFELFRQFFIERGHSELQPSEDARSISRFRFAFNLGKTAYSFSPIVMSEENLTKLMKSTWVLGEEGTGATYMSELDEELYKTLSKLIFEINLARFHTGRLAVGNDCPHTESGYYEIYIDLKNGKQIYDFSAEGEKIADFQRDAGKIVEMFDRYMESHGGHVHKW